MRVLGVDPGTAVTGYGVVDASPTGLGQLVECGVVRTQAADPLPIRLQQIHDGLTEVIERLAPDVLAVEGIFSAVNVRSTIILSHTRGVILLAGAQRGLQVMEYSPAQIKKAVVGRGAAVKPQVGYMVARLLKLKSAPSPADAADGVAVALTHLLMGGARPKRRTAS